MRVLLFLAALLFPVSAWASSDLIVSFCNTQADPRACIRGFIDEQTAIHQAAQDEWRRSQAMIREQYLAAQLEQARLQANGLALFGSGAAMINGVNQGFQNMQLPYVETPMFKHSPSQ